jgi:hypothetical protein
MKHHPNVRPAIRGWAGLFTLASCNAVCESRELPNIEIVWFAVDGFPQMRRDAATNSRSVGSGAAGDAAHTLPDESLRHPRNEWNRGRLSFPTFERAS